MRRLIKLIPDVITSGNLVCGIAGVMCALDGRIDLAFLWMLGGAVCDFCDGLAARLLDAWSKLGKELDSLADMVTFGVLPALILHSLMAYQVRGVLNLLPILMAVFAAFRLAKFNIDDRQHDSFIGLPTPAAAIISGSLAYYVYNEPFTPLAQLCSTAWFIPALALALSVLMVSELPMFSMKLAAGSDSLMKIKRLSFMATALVCVAITLLFGFNWSMAVLMVFTAYILLNIAFQFNALRNKDGIKSVE